MLPRTRDLNLYGGTHDRINWRRTIGVVGAGTMGAGIAQVAAVAGRRVLIADTVPGAAERAVAGIRDRVKAQVAKGRLSVDPGALDLTAVDSADGLAECGVVIEAIIEDLAVKRALFGELETVVAATRSSRPTAPPCRRPPSPPASRTPSAWSACTSSTRSRP